MNKIKRNIIQLRINLIRKLAKSITGFDSCDMWLNKWYTENAKTPLQAAGEVLQLKKSKLNKVYHVIDTFESFSYSNFNNWGNKFTVKFPMIAFVCDINVSVASRHYNNFTNNYKPVKQAVIAVKHYFAKCCSKCKTVYFKKEISKEQFENFGGNDNIKCSFEHNAWVGEIMSCCEECCNVVTDPDILNFYNS